MVRRVNQPPGAPPAQSLRPTWLRATAGVGEYVAVAALAWLALQAVELPDLVSELELRGALAYLTRNALAYAMRAGGMLVLAHLLRGALLRSSRRGDLYFGTALVLGLAMPTWQQAYLLSTGNQIIDSAIAIPLRVGLFVGLLLANLTLWRFHLWLCRAPGLRAPATSTRFTLPMRNLLRAALCVAALVILRGQMGQRLRQYTFFARFLLPSLWLLSSTLAYALQRRLPARARALSLCAAALALGLLVQASPHSVKHAQTVFVRMGDLAGLTDLAVGAHHAPAYANLDVSHPERFRCSDEPAPNTAALRASLVTPQQRRHVILVSVDALRKDVLGALRHGQPVMPELQRFAGESLRFERAVTTYPATLFALGSALTGYGPSEILFAPTPPDNLFTRTRPRFSKQLVSLPDNRWFSKPIVPRLFTQTADLQRGPNAAEQTRSMIARLEWARTRGDSVFAWVHYYETHQSLDNAWHGGLDVRTTYLRDASTIDHELGNLFRYLRSSSYWASSLVIVFADHGEALGERGHHGHHVYLNRWLTDIPLLVHAPGIAAGSSEALASIADISPTVLQWAGVPAPATDARSLLPRPAAVAEPERYAVSEAFPVRGNALFDLAREPIGTLEELVKRITLVQQGTQDYLPKVSVVSARYRLIVNQVTGNEELYDRVNDPDELHDLADAGRPVQARLRAALASWSRTQSSRIYCRVAHLSQAAQH